MNEFVIGAKNLSNLAKELQLKTLDGVGISISDAGSECGLKIIAYHIVPDSKKMRVEQSIWDCFAQAADINTPGDVSCGGRFEAYGRHVKWHPDDSSTTPTTKRCETVSKRWFRGQRKDESQGNRSQFQIGGKPCVVHGRSGNSRVSGAEPGCSYARQGFGRRSIRDIHLSNPAPTSTKSSSTNSSTSFSPGTPPTRQHPNDRQT